MARLVAILPSWLGSANAALDKRPVPTYWGRVIRIVVTRLGQGDGGPCALDLEGPLAVAPSTAAWATRRGDSEHIPPRRSADVGALNDAQTMLAAVEGLGQAVLYLDDPALA